MTAWRIESQPGQQMAILSVLACHDAWDRLTPIQRFYVEHSTEAGKCDWHQMHGHTRRSLVEHGICTDDGQLTPAGMDVKRFRPKPKEAT
jgi:hypothetical protein